MTKHDVGIFGLKDSTWARIDALSASAVAMSLARELLEKRGKKCHLVCRDALGATLSWHPFRSRCLFHSATSTKR